MKNVLFGILYLGLTSLAYSQEIPTSIDFKEVKLIGVTVTPLNTTYLRKVQDKETPEIVKKLENTAARFDVTEASIYDGNHEGYEVVFEQTNGRIIATYDKNGKIISSFEKFTDLNLPPTVRNNIAKKYPNWIVYKDAYLVSYYVNSEHVKKVYKIQIRKDNERKNLRCTVDGVIL
ncbi:hypothetical protein OO009_07990 [Flavobacteriaceae bacterium KMM 6897]|nr:hypothetical protein [Flavobacteriaceae bacterium KMM 6897]MEB8345632.1 hypothetical protein [Flavobacteriaceae bacterium KMM 6898]